MLVSSFTLTDSSALSPQGAFAIKLLFSVMWLWPWALWLSHRAQMLASLPLLYCLYNLACCNFHSRNIVMNNNMWLKQPLEVTTMRKITFKHLGCRLRQYSIYKDIKLSTKSKMPHITFNEWPTQVHIPPLRRPGILTVKLCRLYW